MIKSPNSKRHIDNVANRIKANNQASEEQVAQNNDPDTDEDYANSITKEGRSTTSQPTRQNTTKKNPSAPQPQHSSTPIQQDDHQHQQTAEHDSTSEIENEPQTNITTTDNEQQPHNTDFNTIPATKTSEQNSISSLNTEGIEEPNKFIFD